ncbi:DUF4870 domain-containing protein [Dehalobacterium formicoaceticum]|uniref:DUF4870 domain-containing protein n=1 Tax=Dehalobacterium formicoaceticum TaxID=51515 RepID=A0ABT1Y2W6_9FIRM|nr:DUF4870 domain-containing protein [Dehalobacterium formicoaceticum]MCR6545218.1 DUF4870 domain-containing protein [Dehalobacterium formicoaceticum]
MEYQAYPVTGEQKLLAIAAHLLYLLGGVGFVIAPLIILILKQDDPFVYEHAKQALVAQIMLLIAGAVVSVLCIVLIGFLLIPVLLVLGIIFVITSLIAASRVLNGRLYAYPLIQGIIRRI